MSYDNPHREVYYLPSAAYGATTATKILKGPAGKKGIVRDIVVLLSADAVGTTTVPEVTVGSAAGLVEYARFRLGTSAVAGYAAANTPFRARALATAGPFPGGIPPALSDYAGHIALETAQIPADTGFALSGKAGVGGSPAGTFEAYVHIDWY
jgi:hypothetical protein